MREHVLAKQIEVSEADFRRHLDQINYRRARALYVAHPHVFVLSAANLPSSLFAQ